MTEPRRTTLPHPVWTLIGSLALFLALLVLLAWQVRAGKDPALAGVKSTAQVRTGAPKRVLVRKVIRKVIDDRVVLIPAPEPQVVSSGSASAASGSAAVVQSAPAATYSAPAAAAAPVYSAPAPAPAPAPVVTRTS